MQKRLFVSIPVPADVATFLTMGQERERYRSMRFVPADQFHLTVCFIGDTEDTMLPVIADALTESVAAVRPFSLEFDRVAPFPTKIRQPNMIWAFFKENDPFEDLVKTVKNSLVKADPAFLRLREEWRKDIPHVTLARFRGMDFPRTPRQPNGSVPALHVSGIDLMDSVLYPDGPLYTKLAGFPFNA